MIKRMKTKLPQGLAEIIYFAMGEASMCWSEVPKGIFNSTKADEIAKSLIAKLTERDKAIARAAFEACNLIASEGNFEYPTPDDYLRSEQFKKLVGGV